MGPRLLAAVVGCATCVAGLSACGVQLEDQPVAGDAGVDAADPVDGPIVPAADARACAGGDQRATDPSTGACFVYFTGPVTYAVAEANCTAFGAGLAVVKSAQTNAVVVSLIGQADAFLGANDRDVEGTFRWRGGVADPVTGGYVNWRSGEPNNANGQFEEDCMIIEGDRGGTWDDRPCAPPPVDTGAYAYVCQF